MLVRIYDIAKKTGLENKTVLTRAKALRIADAKVPSSVLDEETAKWLIEELVRMHPEVADKLHSNRSVEIPEANTGTIQTEPVNEPPQKVLIIDPKSIIEKFIIVDGSNVLHWMKANKLSQKTELIPLLIVLTAIKKKGFDFCCYYDASQWFRMREQQPEQFREFKKLRENEKYRTCFSEAPGGTSADDFILLDAKNSKRKVLSNDRFRDNPIQLPEGQFIRGAVVNCQISIPKLDIIESLHSDLRKAVRDLETELNK
jgi:hypothetical protein